MYRYRVSFIDNSSVDISCLISSNIHLNVNGSVILAIKFTKFLRGNKSSKARRNDVRMTTQYGRMIRSIRGTDTRIRNTVRYTIQEQLTMVDYVSQRPLEPDISLDLNRKVNLVPNQRAFKHDEPHDV